MRTALIVGGVPLPQQLHRLRTGVQVVIATPARLNDIITHHTSEIELMDIEVFVVDEVDCLLQMGFENQVPRGGLAELNYNSLTADIFGPFKPNVRSKYIC